MMVVHTAIQKGLKAALWVGVGAAIVEFFQAFISLQFLDLLSTNTQFDLWIRWIAVGVFLVLAFYFFNKQDHTVTLKRSNHAANFWVGVFVSAVNMLAFLFWIFVGTYLNANALIAPNLSSILIFCLGVALGAFGVYALYSKVGIWIQAHYQHLSRNASRVVGGVFVVLTLWQVFENLR